MKTYFAIGLMSGTSLDSLDICYAKFQNITNWEFEILKTKTIPYSPEWKNRLQNAILLSAEDLLALDKEYGFYLGEKTQEFISKNNIADLDLLLLTVIPFFINRNENSLYKSVMEEP